MTDDPISSVPSLVSSSRFAFLEKDSDIEECIDRRLSKMGLKRRTWSFVRTDVITKKVFIEIQEFSYKDPLRTILSIDSLFIIDTGKIKVTVEEVMPEIELRLAFM
jgi:hypothetical protein